MRVDISSFPSPQRGGSVFLNVFHCVLLYSAHGENEVSGAHSECG